MNHIMIDLETVDTAPTAAIVSIGAVQFDPNRGVLGKEFYSKVSLRSCTAVGLTMDAGTISWWMGQGEGARACFLGEDRKPITEALLGLLEIVPAGIKLWSHGSSFDLPILENAMRRVGFLPTWSFRDFRDTRTVYDLARVDVRKFNEGLVHNAIDDARSQAKAVCAAYQRLGIG